MLSDEALCDVSYDQYYAYQICWSIIYGALDTDLQLLEVGPLRHSRRMTLGCQILRYYVSQDKPNLTLVLLTEFCIKIYFPNFFEVKAKSSITDGLRNLFFKRRRVTQFPDKQVRDIALKVLWHNAFFAHPEHVIIVMPSNENKPVREIAVDKIMFLRESVKHSLLATLTTLRNKLRGSKSCEEFQGFIHKQKCNFVSAAS